MANYRQSNFDSTISTGQGITSASQGNNLTATGQEGYLFATGLQKPEVSDILSVLFPQYSTTAILDRIGKTEGVSNSQFDWYEQDRTRKGGTIASSTADGSSNQFTITLSDDTSTGSDGYFLKNDQIMLWDGKTTATVDSVTGGNGSDQVLFVIATGGATPASPTAGDRVGHLASAFGEYSEAPKSRKYYPDLRYNQTQVIRRTCTVSGKNLTDKTYIGNGAWYYKVEGYEMQEIAKDRENAIVFGQLSDAATTNPTCEGILESLFNGGVENTFASAVSEEDLRDHIKDLVVSGGSGQEYMVFCGAQFFSDAQKSLESYYKQGGVNYGAFGDPSKKVGINPQQYLFMGTLINFIHYAGFDDAEALPLPTAGATSINHSNFSMWLNMGSDSAGDSYLSMKYKALEGMQRKFIYKKEVGMTGTGEFVANGNDGESGHMLSEIAPKLKVLNMHGLLYAVGS